MCHTELTHAEKAALESHIRKCEACRADYAAAANITRDDLALTPPALPPDFTNRVMKQVGQKTVKSPRRTRTSYIKWAEVAAAFILALTAVFIWTERKEAQEQSARIARFERMFSEQGFALPEEIEDALAAADLQKLRDFGVDVEKIVGAPPSSREELRKRLENIGIDYRGLGNGGEMAGKPFFLSGVDSSQLTDEQRLALYEKLWRLGERKGEIHDTARQLPERLYEPQPPPPLPFDEPGVSQRQRQEPEKLRDFGIPVEKIVKAEPSPPIDGKVVAYDPPTQLALLSVGKRDGVKEGYEFTIYRGDKFVARVKVEKVLDDMCGARVIFKVADIKKSDSAATRLGTEASKKSEEKRADVIYLETGGKIVGKVVAETETAIQIKVASTGKTIEVKREDITKISYGAPEAAKKKPAKTWKRGKPTFARVYVGGGNSLELVKMDVKVTVEGMRARTVVDHIFRNPHNKQLQGTFEYPLPAGASPCYYAMFIGSQNAQVPAFSRGSQLPENLPELSPQEIAAYAEKKFWGKLKEARIVKKETARVAYEEIVRRKIDPALLEYAGANTFRGRVFPIPAKGYNRVIIAYEQTLERVDEQLRYRFPLPDCELKDLNFALTAASDDCRNPAFNTKKIEKSEKEGKLLYAGEWSKQGPGGEAVFSFTPPRQDIQYISGLDGKGGPYYFYAHLRPQLSEEEAARFAKHAVFILDTSLSEEPDRFNISIKLLTKILESDTSIEKFQVLLFDVGARWLMRPTGFWLANTEKGRRAVLTALDDVLLEGATDLSAALDVIAARKELNPVDIFLLSDGQVNWGRTGANQVVARFESRAKFHYRFFCYRTGLSAENLTLFDLLTRRGGAVFNCFSEDMVAKAALAHRRHCFQVTGINTTDNAVSELLVAGRKGAIYPGGEIVVAGKCAKPGHIELELTGMFKGKEVKFSFPVKVTDRDKLAPRAWGEIAVASLVALDKPELDDLITAYCQHFSIGSKAASFLILETEADYKQFNISNELGEIKVEDIAKLLDAQWEDAGRELTPKEAFERFLRQIDERVKLTTGRHGKHVKSLIAALGPKDYELPEAVSSDRVLSKSDVSAPYLKARAGNRRNVGTYTEEAKRRGQEKEFADALRALSCVVELYPGRCDALRLVGYRALEMGAPAAAAGLFRRVQESRPFEPQSYRDLARALELAGKPGLAALQYEILLAGKWHSRFHSLKQVVLEEYCMLMRAAINQKSASEKLLEVFGGRLENLAVTEGRADLRVTISWNTDNTDIDLWVIEPGGEKCYYQHKQTKSGGVLLDDLTEGYGPERYHITKAQKGVYTVKVHYYGTNPNLLGGETYVTATVTRYAGTDRQETSRYNVVLTGSKQEVEVCRIKF
jgi:hypothetical protein